MLAAVGRDENPHALDANQFHVPCEQAGKTAFDANPVHSDQGRRTRFAIVLEHNLLKDAAWPREIGLMEGTGCHRAGNLVRQCFDDRFAAEGPGERQHNDCSDKQAKDAQRRYLELSRISYGLDSESGGHRRTCDSILSSAT